MNLDRLIRFYQALSAEGIARFPDFYSADAYFRDSFNEVRGIAAIQHIFTRMFEQVGEPGFRVIEQVSDDHGVMLVWDFHYRMGWWGKGKRHVMRGVSHLRFDANGKVNYHRDYCDVAEELYMKLPGLGFLMRSLRSLFAA